MTFRIFRNDDANCVFIENTNGPQFFDAIQAVLVNPTDTVISLVDLSRTIDIVTAVPYGDFLDSTGTPWGTTAVEAVDAMNAVFGSSGTPSSNVPVITSALAVTITEGDALNYELIASDGVGYEWADLPAGVTTVEGNVRKLVGGTGLTNAGSPYAITMKAINYNGEDSETLTLTVDAPAWNNTKSVKYQNNDYMNAAATTANPLYRASNGVGSGDAWSISTWFKGGTSSQSQQTILSFGGNDENNEGRVDLMWDASAGDRLIRLRYGSKNNRLTLETPIDSYLQGTWRHILVTYDGGTTGSSQGDLSDYYGRFDIFINGVSQTLGTSHNNYGWSGEIVDDAFRLGEAAYGGDHLRNSCFIDELALWDSDETANAAAIYNSGTTHDLAILGSAPTHYWRMGDEDTFPTIEDNVGSLDFTMFNMTSSDIVTDVP